MIILCCLIFPANILAIYRYYRQNINKIFFTLITSLCVINMIYGCIGFVNAVAKLTDQHPFGWFGCGISYCIGCTILNITMAIEALISYERRKVITNVQIATFSTRVYVMLSVSIASLIGFWLIMYSKLVTLHFIPIRFDKNSTATVDVCIAKSHVFPGFLELVFSFTELIIPGAIIIYNYL